MAVAAQAEMEPTYIDLTRNSDIVLGDVHALRRDFRHEHTQFADPHRTTVVPNATNDLLTLSSTTRSRRGGGSRIVWLGSDERTRRSKRDATYYSANDDGGGEYIIPEGDEETLGSNILDEDIPTIQEDNLISKMRICNFKAVKCLGDDDCAKSCGIDTFKCIYPPGGTTREGGVCGRKRNKTTVEPYVPCSSTFGNNVAHVVDGVVRWTCKSKYPGLVNDFGINISCRQGIFVHERTAMPYIPGFHDPLACRCSDCPAGFVETQTGCAKDSCYPGVRNWNKDSTTRAIYGEVARNIKVNWHEYEAAAFGQADGSTCLCPRGYVSCPGPAIESEELPYMCPMASEHHKPVCVPDPCNRGINLDNVSYYSHARRRCMQAVSPYDGIVKVKGTPPPDQQGHTATADEKHRLDNEGISDYHSKLPIIKAQTPNPTKQPPLERQGIETPGPWVVAFTSSKLGPKRGFLTKLSSCMGYDTTVPRRAPPISAEEWWGIWQPHMQPALRTVIEKNTSSDPPPTPPENVPYYKADIQTTCIM